MLRKPQGGGAINECSKHPSLENSLILDGKKVRYDWRGGKVFRFSTDRKAPLPRKMSIFSGLTVSWGHLNSKEHVRRRYRTKSIPHD